MKVERETQSQKMVERREVMVRREKKEAKKENRFYDIFLSCVYSS